MYFPYSFLKAHQITYQHVLSQHVVLEVTQNLIRKFTVLTDGKLVSTEFVNAQGATSNYSLYI